MRPGNCTKTAFATQQTAQAKLNRVMWKRRTGKSGYAKSSKIYRVTRCPTCGLWHLSARNGLG